ncbi:MAG TPA: SRPBCC domain-containing protein [Chloroflexota bacterium]|nr:SRPBCC domain-containing protein [Chloroflexota bacterium]
MSTRRPVGQTAGSGFQIGVRKTLPFTPDEIWSAVLSPEGTGVWLGGPVEIAEAMTYRLEDGTTGTIRVYTPGSHIRLTWQPAGWTQASVIQIRVIPAKTGTTLSFHREQLAGPAERAAMKERWDRVIARLYLLIGDRTAS